LKQNELRQIEKDQPELYRQFVSDITQLDSSYNSLKKELPANPNREQLLEAMIQNLQLQTELLNQQLRIIKQIKQAKNKSHDNNSKTI
jgi:phage shock protein A